MSERPRPKVIEATFVEDEPAEVTAFDKRAHKARAVVKKGAQVKNAALGFLETLADFFDGPTDGRGDPPPR